MNKLNGLFFYSESIMTRNEKEIKDQNSGFLIGGIEKLNLWMEDCKRALDRTKLNWDNLFLVRLRVIIKMLDKYLKI